MAIIKKTIDNTITICADFIDNYKVENIETHIAQKYGNLLVQRKTQKRQLELISAIRLLAELLGFLPDIIYDDNGKPQLINSEYNISISHTKNIVCVAISEKYHIGIDIEEITHRISKLTSYFMSDEEIKMMQQLDEKEQNQYATAVWCAKESVYKIVGKSVYDFRKTILISDSPTKHIATALPTQQSFTLNRINDIDNHIIIVAHD